ncbi:GNAT family N-acetyltransferase [Plantactinospora sp. GCM10030261]|uniref:GNAT family N-acetyltransferase n=1 Tax=Plantactinospora sp. GCM10030261 TaxID=3273420 RepID=UPI00360A79DE
MIIRVAGAADAEALVALRSSVYPYLVRGAESTRRMLAEPIPGEDEVVHVAELDGWLIVGAAAARRNATSSTGDLGDIMLCVRRAHRRRGAGTALLYAALAHLRTLGVRRVRAFAQPDSLDFARRHGFTPSREVRYSGLPLSPAPPAPRPPDGVRLRPLTDWSPAEFFPAYVAAASDEPGDEPVDAIGFDHWRADVWDEPDTDLAGSVVATVDGVVAAFTIVRRDGDRMWSDMTATVPAYRGRGLAALVKRAALHRAAGRGVTMAYTSNDEANAPMLAVNDRLGYRPVGAQWSCLRDL